MTTNISRSDRLDELPVLTEAAVTDSAVLCVQTAVGFLREAAGGDVYSARDSF
jgi:hypothetical protein